MDSRHRLTRGILRLVLAAALLTSPIFLIAEGVKLEYVLRVLASNGLVVVLCVWLLARLRRGQLEFAARTLVFSLLVLVGALAWFNGEDVHVNVVNFVFVTVLAGVLLERRALLIVGPVSAVVMLAIAWLQPIALEGGDLIEARLESTVQFLPTYIVIVLVLWLRGGVTVDGDSRGSDTSGGPPGC